MLSPACNAGDLGRSQAAKVADREPVPHHLTQLSGQGAILGLDPEREVAVKPVSASRSNAKCSSSQVQVQGSQYSYSIVTSKSALVYRQNQRLVGKLEADVRIIWCLVAAGCLNVFAMECVVHIIHFLEFGASVPQPRD